MKLCKDCKWCELVTRGGEDYSKCSSPRAARTVDLVTGISELRWKYCAVHRATPMAIEGACGPDGLFFEPKEEMA